MVHECNQGNCHGRTRPRRGSFSAPSSHFSSPNTWAEQHIFRQELPIFGDCMPGRRTRTHTSFCRELIVLPGTCVELLTPASPLSLIYHLYVLFVWISYQARFGLNISYPAIVFTMVIGLLNCGSFIVHILLLGTSKVFTLSVFLPCACVHVLLPGTRRYTPCCYIVL